MINSNFQVPVPKDWQEFERLCRRVFSHRLNDPTMTMNGTSGQRQNGVDIFGTDRVHKTGAYGIQCKGKDRNFGKPVTKKELLKEVEEAKKFSPPLNMFILATTTQDDVEIQRIAREITEIHKQNNLFEVHVYGWNTLTQDMPADIILEIFPALIELAKFELKKEARLDSEKSIALASNLQIAGNGLGSSAFDAAQSDTTNKVLNGVLDSYRDLLKDGKPETAIKLLTDVKHRDFATADNSIKFRIITNLGAAYLHTGNRDMAASHFIEALQYEPDNKLALANAITGYLLQNKTEKAIEIGAKAQQAHPNEPVILSRMAIVFSNEQELEVWINKIPIEITKHPEVALAISSAYSQFSNKKKFIEWATLAYNNDEKNREEIKEAYASALLTPIFDKAINCSVLVLSSSEQKNLEKSQDILESLWISHQDREASNIRYAVAFNYANSLRIGDKLNEAFGVINKAILLYPNDKDLISLRASMRLEMGDYDAAYDDIKKANNSPENLIKQAYILWKLSRYSEALAIVAPLSQSTDRHIARMAHFIKADIATEYGKIDDVIEDVQKIWRNNYKDYEFSTLMTRLLREVGRKEEAVAVLNNSARHISKATHLSERYLVAQEFFQLDKPARSVDLLRGKIDVDNDNGALRLFLRALLHSDNRKKLIQTIEQLPSKLSSMSYYLRMAALGYEKVGLLNKSIEKIEALLKSEPDYFTARLDWIFLKLRNGDNDDVMSFLGQNLNYGDATAKQKVDYAHILISYGFKQKGLDLAYETLRANPDDAEVHAKYVGLLLAPTMDEFLSQPKTIDVDTSFTVQDRLGTQRTYTILGGVGHSPSRYEISSDDPLALRAIGHKVQDDLEVLSNRTPPDIQKIVAIKPKYLAALHHSMDALEHQFPHSKVLEKIEIAEDNLEPILERTKEFVQQRQTLLNYYTEHGFPIGFIARVTNNTTISVYHGISRQGISVRSCLGSDDERRQAFRAIGENYHKGCILDAVTLYIVRRLKIEKILNKVLGQIHITQTTLDVFTQMQSDAHQNMRSGVVSVTYKDGVFYRDEISPELMKKAHALYSEDIAWIRENCKIISAMGDVSFFSDRQEEILDRASIDTIAALAEHNILLVTEDMGLRKLAYEHTGMSAIWLQAVLMIGKKKSILNPVRPPIMNQQEYTTTIATLCEAGHSFVSINDADLIYLDSQQDDDSKRKFKKLLDTLGSKNAEFVSCWGVAFSFLLKLRIKAKREHFAEVISLILGPQAELRDDKINYIQSTLLEALAKATTPEQMLSINEILALLREWKQSH